MVWFTHKTTPNHKFWFGLPETGLVWFGFASLTNQTKKKTLFLFFLFECGLFEKPKI
jgi:hypothetical protein